MNHGEFWQIIARREGTKLNLVGALPWNEVIANSVAPKSGKQSKSPSKKSKSVKTESVMINGRTPEITIKFSEKPELPETGKKVTLQITGDNGIVVRADMNRKTLQKNVEKMDSYSAWTAALSGKVVKVDHDGVIELEGAGLTVFEKKTKEKENLADDSP